MKAILVYTRGKNRDIYGNPYWAASVHCKADDGHMHIIDIPMNWGSSDEWSAAMAVTHNLNRWGIVISCDCTFIHKQVYRDSALERPENWRCIMRGNLVTHETRHAECC